jgi:DNA-binding response OmpR family regulator
MNSSLATKDMPCDDASASQADAERVLVVGDGRDLKDLVVLNVRGTGFEVRFTRTGHGGLEAARTHDPSVVVLERTLPDMLGTEVCEALRQDARLADVGILMLTGRGREDDCIEGFEAGADDCVVRPFSVRELVLRIRAIAARSRFARVSKRRDVHRWRGIEVDLVRHRVAIDGVPVTLRPLELKLLATLLPAPGTIFSRAELLRLVWGVDEATDTRTVDTHVHRLRERLGAYGHAIETVPHIGYRWHESAGNGRW